MRSFIQFREWQDIKRLANRAANLMVELDVDAEVYLSEFVESYNDELLEQGTPEEKKGWWGRLKDKFKATRWGGAIAGATAAGKEHAGLPKFKFDKAMAGLQALVTATPDNVKGVRQRNLKSVLQSLVDALKIQKDAIDAVGPKPSEMGGFSSQQQKDRKKIDDEKNLKSVSTQQDVDPGLPKPDVRIAAAGFDPTKAVEAYDPSKGSWYVNKDGKVVANLPSEKEAGNGFFGTW